MPRRRAEFASERSAWGGSCGNGLEAPCQASLQEGDRLEAFAPIAEYGSFESAKLPLPIASGLPT